MSPSTQGVLHLALLLRLLLLTSVILDNVDALDNGLARLPPIGWISGERFSCLTDCDNYPDDCISERLIRSMADVMSLPSFQRAGFKYIIVDDCWMDRNRDSSGKLQADVRRFPSGIQDLISYVHSKNLRIGLYLDLGNQTCGGYPGSKGNFSLDAQTLASWEVDLVKAGACGVANYADCNSAYPEFGRQLNMTGRQILYHCDWPGAIYAKGGGQVSNFGDISRTCNLFKAYGGTIQDIWDTMADVFKYYSDTSYLFRDWIRPGSYSDADQLLMGNFGLSNDQQRFQMAFWSLIMSPLFVSTDLRTLGPDSKRILLNRRVIDVNQDPLADMPTQIQAQGQLYIWKKRLSLPGAFAVGLFYTNIFGQPSRASFRLSDYNIVEAVAYNVTDILTGLNYGLYKPWHTLDCEVNPMGARLLRFDPVDEFV